MPRPSESNEKFATRQRDKRETGTEHPMHARYTREREKMELVRDFIEDCITKQRRPGKDWPRAYASDPNRAASFGEMTDKEKEHVILSFFEIDQQEFYDEKERMVAQLQDDARKRES